VLAVRHHLGLDAAPETVGAPSFTSGPFADQQHLELELGARRPGELLHLEEVALLTRYCFPPVLITAYISNLPVSAWDRPRWQGNPAAGRERNGAI